LNIILHSRYWPVHSPTHTNFRRRQKLQNSGGTTLIPEQLRHRSVPRRPLPFRCLANCAPHGYPLIFPLAAVFEEVLTRLRGAAVAPPAIVIRRFPNLGQIETSVGLDWWGISGVARQRGKASDYL
jgi:hypothetical protein